MRMSAWRRPLSTSLLRILNVQLEIVVLTCDAVAGSAAVRFQQPSFIFFLCHFFHQLINYLSVDINIRLEHKIIGISIIIGFDEIGKHRGEKKSSDVSIQSHIPHIHMLRTPIEKPKRICKVSELEN